MLGIFRTASRNFELKGGASFCPIQNSALCFFIKMQIFQNIMEVCNFFRRIWNEKKGWGGMTYKKWRDLHYLFMKASKKVFCGNNLSEKKQLPYPNQQNSSLRKNISNVSKDKIQPIFIFTKIKSSSWWHHW